MVRNNRYIVSLQKGCYLANWEGDPGRSYNKVNAKVFEDKASAERALKKSRKYRPFKSALILLYK